MACSKPSPTKDGGTTVQGDYNFFDLFYIYIPVLS